MRQIKIQIKLLLTGLLAVVSSMVGVVNAAENTSAIDNLTADEIYRKSYFVGKAGDTELRKIKAGEDFYYLLKLGTGIYKHHLDEKYKEVAYLMLDQNHIMDYMMFLKGLIKHFPITRNEGENYEENLNVIRASSLPGKVLVFERDGNPGKSLGKYILTVIGADKVCSDYDLLKCIKLRFRFSESIIIGIPPNTKEVAKNDDFSIDVRFNDVKVLTATIDLIQKAVLTTGTNANPDTFERLGDISPYLSKNRLEVLAYSTKKSKRFYVEGENKILEGKRYNTNLWLDKNILDEFINWLEEIVTKLTKMESEQNIGEKKVVKFEPSTNNGGVIIGTFDTEMTITAGSSLSDSILSAKIYYNNKVNKFCVYMKSGNWWLYTRDKENLKTLIDILKSKS